MRLRAWYSRWEGSAEVSRIQATTRKVFIGGGRASFSRAAAYRNEARARIKKKYPCSCFDEPETGYHETCDRHEWPVGKWSKLVHRLARFMRWLDKREREDRSLRLAGKERARRIEEQTHRADVCKAVQTLKQDESRVVNKHFIRGDLSDY